MQQLYNAHAHDKRAFGIQVPVGVARSMRDGQNHDVDRSGPDGMCGVVGAV